MQKLKVTVSPHITSRDTTHRIMRDVAIALVPALAASVWLFGVKSIYIILTCVITAVLSESLFCKICKKESTVSDLSAVVTGLLLAMSLPISVELWQAAVGSFIAIVAVKCLFGGIGQNFANPAVTARTIMLISFGTTGAAVFPTAVDTVSSATPLAEMAAGNAVTPTIADMLIGLRGGAIGEGCIVALVMGGIYLLARRVISWHAPIACLATVFVFTAIIGYFKGMDYTYPIYHLLSGGIMLASFFMITDYSTTPFTGLGKAVFGIGCGIITVIIRVWGNYPEGVSFAILIMNILSPYIDRLTERKVFGGKTHA